MNWIRLRSHDVLKCDLPNLNRLERGIKHYQGGMRNAILAKECLNFVMKTLSILFVYRVYQLILCVPCASGIWTSLGFTLDPTLANGRPAPRNVTHIKSGQKWHKNIHLTTFTKAHSKSPIHSLLEIFLCLRL